MRGLLPLGSRKPAFRTARAFRRRMEKEWVAIRSTQHPREAGARKKRAAGVAEADGAGRPPLAPERTSSLAMTQGNPGCADALGHSPVRAGRIRNDGDCLRGKASAEGICFAWGQYITIEPSRPHSRLVTLSRKRRMSSQRVRGRNPNLKAPILIPRFLKRRQRYHLVVLQHGSLRAGLRIEPAYQHDFLPRLVWTFTRMLDAPARPCLLGRFAGVLPCDDDAMRPPLSWRRSLAFGDQGGRTVVRHPARDVSVSHRPKLLCGRVSPCPKAYHLRLEPLLGGRAGRGFGTVKFRASEKTSCPTPPIIWKLSS